MRTSNLLALSFLVAGGCSAEHIGAQQEADTLTGSVYITQVYGSGGNAGAAVDHDYIELENVSSDAVTLSAYSVFYRGATGSTWQSTALPLNLELPPGGHYLVTEAGTTGIGTKITGDTTGSINFSGTAGVVALATSATTTPAAPTPAGTTIDLVGYGTSATLFEGTGPAPAPSATKADIRTGQTGDNKADFVAGTPAPVNAASAPDMDVDMQPDLTPVADMVVTTTGPFTALLNEVKLHPSSKPSENGQEFIELEGSGQLPVHTFVVAISGDTGNPKGSTAGLIDYVFDVSAQSFTSSTASAPSLMLIKAAATTFPGVAADTVTLNDANLNTAKLGDYTESIVLVTVPDLVANPLVVGSAFPTSITTFIDSIAVRGAAAADGGLDPVFGDAVLEACASDGTTKTYPASGVSRIITNTTANVAAAWYGGQYEKAELASEQYLGDVADCSGASGAPEVWVMTPGAPNSPTVFPDLAQPIVDFAGSTLDFATPSDDLATSSGDDLAANVPDAGHTTDGGTTIKPGGNIGGSGCAEGGHGAVGWPAALLVLGLAGLLSSRRRA